MNCEWEEEIREDGRFHCKREECGGICTKRDAQRNCDIEKINYAELPMQLGDAFAIFLASYNINKTGECGCDDRRQKFNQFGNSHPTIAAIGVKLLTALTRKT